MAGAVCVPVFMLVKDDLQSPTIGLGDPAQRLEAWHMIAALQARDHRFGHLQALRHLSLGFTGFAAKRQ